jgi:hypothetical protein
MYEQISEFSLNAILVLLRSSALFPRFSLNLSSFPVRSPAGPYIWYLEPCFDPFAFFDSLGRAIKFHCEGCGIALANPREIPSRVG